MVNYGPFDVAPEQIKSLGADFTRFVNVLLDFETTAANLAGESLSTTAWDNVPDGGVDAKVQNDSSSTRWMPSGTSAWQFKRGDLGPAKCKAELRDAAWALDLVRSGAEYRLVLGAGLT